MNNILKSGFTLVELAIVLVIIGLLVGGILGGRSLIRQAEIAAVLSEQQSFVRAVATFQTKYDALPGDMKNAFDFFGSDCGTNTIDPSTGCNGNGDNIIRGYNIGGGAESLAEGVKAWEHMARSGLIAGKYDGTGTSPDGLSVALDNNNIPKSKLAGTHWAIGEYNCESCNYIVNNQVALGMVTLTLGAVYNSGGDAGWLLPAPNLTNGEASSMDIKVDDGHSQTGKLRGVNANGACGDGSGGDPTDYYDVVYVGANTKGQCNPTFIIRGR